jgi:hypothetical protein
MMPVRFDARGTPLPRPLPHEGGGGGEGRFVALRQDLRGGDTSAPAMPVRRPGAASAVREADFPAVPAAGFNRQTPRHEKTSLPRTSAVEGVREGGLRAVVAAISIACPSPVEPGRLSTRGAGR